MSKYNIQADSPIEALRLFVEQFHEHEPTLTRAVANGVVGDAEWSLCLSLVPRKKPVLRLVKKE